VILFWLLAPVMVLAALGMVLVRKAVHSAMLLAVVMICLAVLYALQDAPFLFAVQIIVYTGAILMLFLFVLMLVGVDASDSLVETLRGQRLLAVVVGVGLGLLLALGAAQAVVAPVVGLTEANAQGNVPALAGLLFNKYVWAFEVTSALLITAALGAMVLTMGMSRGQLKPGQRATVQARLRGEHDRISPLPGPGVFATGNSVAVPALLPDGSIAPESISAIIDATPAEVIDEHPVDPHALTAGTDPARSAADPSGKSR
jgi:NADH-quinone oxidoreductase subunit J